MHTLTQTTTYHETLVTIQADKLAPQDQFLPSFFHRTNQDKEFPGLLSVHILNRNNIPTKIELHRASSDGQHIHGYITARYARYFEDGMVI